jgi:Glycine/D-amino acid oxidases (deaminating)
MTETTKESVRLLLAEIVDYAGLFPPSAVSMAEAVTNFANYKNSSYNWMLGRFVVPVTRLAEFAVQAEDFFMRDDEIWRLSVLASDDIDETLSLVEDFNERFSPYAACDALEIKTDSCAYIETVAAAVPPDYTNYFEIPIREDLADFVVTLAVNKQRAKIRTGGVTPEAFPRAETITRFIRTCLAANVPFKATAGLHHPIRCRRPLTYEADAPIGVMYGFLNVFLAAAFARQGFKPSLLNEILEEEWEESFVFEDSGVLWRQEHFVSSSQIKYLREKSAISFGSCSFEEPVADLKELGLL